MMFSKVMLNSVNTAILIGNPFFLLRRRKMPQSTDILKIRSFVEENMGKILVVTGLMLLLLGVLLLSSFTSLASVSFLYFGATITLTGFLVQLEIVTSNFSIRQRIGVALILASVFFFSGSFISIVYTEVGPWIIRPGGEDEFLFRIKIIHPSAWLSGILFLIGMGIFIIGFVIKYR